MVVKEVGPALYIEKVGIVAHIMIRIEIQDHPRYGGNHVGLGNIFKHPGVYTLIQLIRTGSGLTLHLLDFIDGVNTDLQGEIQICSIIDCYCENSKVGHQIYEKLVAVINNKQDESIAKFDYEFIEKENKARFVLFGNPDYVIKSLQLL